jgi:NIPSNAP protein
MAMSRRAVVMVAAGMFLAGFGIRETVAVPAAHAQGSRVFEIRTYTAAPGKLGALKTRFRDHTVGLFTKHGMTNIGYWTPRDPPLSENTLIYVLAHSSREAAQKSWDAFRKDPDWIKAKAASETDGSLTTKVDSIFADATDFSPIK